MLAKRPSPIHTNTGNGKIRNKLALLKARCVPSFGLFSWRCPAMPDALFAGFVALLPLLRRYSIRGPPAIPLHNYIPPANTHTSTSPIASCVYLLTLVSGVIEGDRPTAMAVGLNVSEGAQGDGRHAH